MADDNVDAGDAALAFQKLHPDAFFEKFVNQGVRPDGRGIDEVRERKIKLGVVSTADGSASVSLGKTSVVCGIRFMVGTKVGSAEGQFRVRVSLLPVCSPRYDGRVPDLAVCLGEFLNKLAEGNSLIDRADLDIEDGVAQFILDADIVCLSDDGNLFDASLLALVGALENLRLPNVSVVEADSISGEETVEREVVQVGLDRPNRVRLMHYPVPATFGIFKGKFLIDPTQEELEVLHGTITVVLNEKGKVISVYKPTGAQINSAELDKLLDLCAQHSQDILPRIRG